MQGTNFFTLVDGSTTCWVAFTEMEGEIETAQPGMVAKCIGVPPTTTNVFGTGCLMLRTDNGSMYQNTGTFVAPIWTLMVQTPGGGGGSAYSLGAAASFVSLAASAMTFTSFASPSIIASGNIGQVTLSGNPVFTYPAANAGTTGLSAGVAAVLALWTQLKALSGTAITTPATLETNNLSGLGAGVFAPGIYTTSSAIGMTASSTITLSGAGDYVFVSTGGAITFGATDKMLLTNGATAARIYWVANNAITTGSTDTLFGNFITGPTGSITIGSTNIIVGRLLSQLNTTIDGTATSFALPS